MARSEIGTPGGDVTLRTGVVATYEAFDVADGSFWTNTTQNTVLHVKNADAAAHMIHIISQKTEDGLAIKDIVKSVGAGTEEFFGPYANALYGASGIIQVDCYDASGPTFHNVTDAVAAGVKNTTGVTAAVIKLGTL